MFNHTTLARIFHADSVTDNDRKHAMQGMYDFFQKIDLWAIERYRIDMKLPPEALGLMVSVFVAHLDPMYTDRAVLPISSVGGKVAVEVDGQKVADFGGSIMQGTSVSLKVQVKEPFNNARLFISNAGTEGGAADWSIMDIKVDGKSELAQAGQIPGDMFATNSRLSDVRLTECRKSIEIIVKYIGKNAAGCPFFASFVGYTNRPSASVDDDGQPSTGLAPDGDGNGKTQESHAVA